MARHTLLCKLAKDNRLIHMTCGASYVRRGRSKHFCGVSYHHGPILSQQVQQKKRSLKRSFIGFARKRL
uniref:Ovule protein n=1 Tax=Ascaris lumbricoides TaxID=6252 RepID=A0A0M3HSY7_ASCLU